MPPFKPSLSPTLSSKWSIGKIVSLKSHPFFAEKDYDSIVIAGDPNLHSPLLVIVELLKEGKVLFDENTGLPIVDTDSYQCRCIWFSQKSFQIEEAWFSTKLLKPIELENTSNDAKDKNPSLGYGTMVVLKTAKIELKKKKSSFKKSLGLNEDANKSITSILTFVSPVMHVIGTVKSDNKEALIDAKTGEKKREISSLLIKCRYYNYISDKLSEALIPREALEVINTVDEEKINLIKKAIQDKSVLKVENDSYNTLVRPEKINYINGYFNLDCYNYLTNSLDEISITNQYSFFELSEYIVSKLPFFSTEDDGSILLKRISAENIKTLDETKYWRIKYKDKNDKITYRTIHHCSFANVFELDHLTGELEPVQYLKAFCLLRKAERYFLSDRIQEIVVLNLNIEIG